MQNFESHINGNKPVVAVFTAEWSGKSDLMIPILEMVSDALGERGTVLNIDISKHPQYAQQYGIHKVPAIIIFRNGHIIWHKTGFVNAREILDHLALTLADH